MTLIDRRTGVVEASRGCFLLQADELPQHGQRAEYGSLLVDPGSGQLELLTGREDGPVDLTVEVHDELPPASPQTWHESVIATVRWERVTTARVGQLDIEMAEEWEVALPAPHFVLEVRYRESGEREQWLLRLWPEVQ
ncbi:hypothetical protein GCM10022243_00290 [Saccharothrix violaceirubra]|uniref:Uncharacterized protein n=1 Tax=Saccharothrix violaceirubra TaxID=413306 RepID=A0A7W7WW09_9PSEU|nr:hypothetical protein [Saccharothrix violaceirubra]MBB4965477.1 hypothetical protein [Saccharothrix violaceirubra]